MKDSAKAPGESISDSPSKSQGFNQDDNKTIITLTIETELSVPASTSPETVLDEMFAAIDACDSAEVEFAYSSIDLLTDNRD